MNEWLLAYGSYLLIPFIAALAGWGTNWLAIKMTFYPLVYVGIYPFGWRGVVPARIAKFASGMVDTMVHGERSERISAQPPAEFQDLICPIFHEDEWILVAIGGALGALVGWGQLVLLFGERLIATGVNVG
jgi:uncharacterized membrane protein YheB (UPF0754 family)